MQKHKHIISRILVFGFYGIVNSDDLKAVFGAGATRPEFNELRMKTYSGQYSLSGEFVNYLGLDEDTLEHLHLQFFKSASRFKVYDGHDLCTLDNHFYQLLYYAQKLLLESDVTTVIFNTPPHAPQEVMIYEVAQMLPIKTIICMQNLFPASFFVMNTLGGADGYLSSSKGYRIPEGHLSYSEQDLDLPYMSHIVIPEVNIFKRVFSPIIKSIHWRPLRRVRNKRSLVTFISDWQLYNNWKKAKKIAKISLDELPEVFVYAPLHFQPEATTQSIGGSYYNQAFMVRELRAILPGNVEIIVKENPLQDIYGRGLEFYDMLAVLPGVRWVKDDAQGKTLIKRSIATATITGTAGWEALRMKKPVIYFGHAWYAQIFGAFPVSNDVMDQIRSFQPDEPRFRASVEKLGSKLFEGFVAHGFGEGKPEMGYQENIECLKNQMKFLLDDQENCLTALDGGMREDSQG